MSWNLQTMMVMSSNNLYCMARNRERGREMNENKNPWVVLVVRDFYVVARNGSDGSPDIFDSMYYDWHDAQERADWMNDEDGITDAPRFDDDF